MDGSHITLISFQTFTRNHSRQLVTMISLHIKTPNYAHWIFNLTFIKTIYCIKYSKVHFATHAKPIQPCISNLVLADCSNGQDKHLTAALLIALTFH